jgi:hypothetical protein
VILVGLRLWAVALDDGTGQLVAVVVVIVAVTGLMVGLVWWRSSVSGERMATKARGLGFLAGSVWYASATPVEQPSAKGLLVVRRTSLAWLPHGLDPTLVREVPLTGTSVHLDPGACRVLAAGLGTFRVHTVKGLSTALETVGVPVG